jgi:hypothetical protein
MLSPTTVRCKLRINNRLRKKVNLWDMGSIDTYLINSSMTNGHKESVSYVYKDWCKFKGFDCTPRRFKMEEKLPQVPKESDIDKLISGCVREAFKTDYSQRNSPSVMY